MDSALVVFETPSSEKTGMFQQSREVVVVAVAVGVENGDALKVRPAVVPLVAVSLELEVATFKSGPSFLL